MKFLKKNWAVIALLVTFIIENQFKIFDLIGIDGVTEELFKLAGSLLVILFEHFKNEIQIND